MVVTVEGAFVSKEKGHKEQFHPEIFRVPETLACVYTGLRNKRLGNSLNYGKFVE